MHAARWTVAFVVGSLAGALPVTASAQDWRSDARGLVTPLGEYVLLGGGVTDFADDSVNDRFDMGGAWDVRLGIGSRFFVGGELAYVGSMRSGIGSEPDLLMNGGEGVVRLQYPYSTGKWLLEPFAFGGIGWSRISLQDAPAGVKSNDDVGFVPFGAGVTLGYGRVLFDARFTYRTSFNEPDTLGAVARPASLDQWTVGASIGAEF
jgi:hypothetical protein